MPRIVLVSLALLLLVPAAFPQTAPPLTFGPEVIVGPEATGSSHQFDVRGAIVGAADGAVAFFRHKDRPGFPDSSIRALRIGRDGRPDPSTLRTLVPNLSTFYWPTAARTGDGWMLVWPSAGSLFASRVNTDLTLRNPEGILLGEGTRAHLDCNGERCMAVFNNRLTVLDAATAAPIASTIAAVGDYGFTGITAASDGTFVMTWIDNADPAGSSLHAARVTTTARSARPGCSIVARRSME